MGCTITISSVIGIPAGPPAPAGAIGKLVVTGTATNLASVWVGFQQPLQFPVTNRQWTAELTVVPIDPTQWPLFCGQTIEPSLVNASDDPNQPNCFDFWPHTTQTLPCDCPAVTVDPPAVADCAGGQRVVTLTTNVTQPAGQTTFFEWDYGDPSPDYGGAFQVTGTGSNTAQHPYSPGTYTAQLNTVAPQGCPPISVQVSVPSCDCPQIQNITFSDGPCDAQGNRLVTATVVGGPSGAITWQWVGIDPQAQSGGTTYTESLPGGSTNTLVVVIQAGACKQSLPKTHTVDSCGPVVCPSITAISANPASGTAPLSATFQATVTNPGAVVGGFQWNFGDGNSVNTPNPTTSHTYSSPGNYTATVTVNGPQGCIGQNPSAASTTVTVTSGNGNGHCGLFCNILCDILLILALVLLVVASVGFIVAFCGGSAAPQVLAAIAITAGIGLLLLFLWGLLCGKFFCKVLNVLSWIFSFIAPITGIIGFVLKILENPCGLGWLSDALIWTIALAVVGWLSSITGCRIFNRL